MVNKDRMANEFIELVMVDSLSKNERKMADLLKNKLKILGLDVYEDNAGNRIGGNSGNIIASLKGSKNVPAVIFMAHMDTVVPGIGKKPIIEGDYIKTDGTTVLGGDDAAGIECILEALKVINENGIEHGDIQVAFTVAEEIGLLGSKNMDFTKIYSKYGFVLDDGGPIGEVSINAPSHYKINAVIKGKAVHAGLEPEKGINAIQIASDAISNMKLGRIDDETTANIGIIKGGQATNIVCDMVEVYGECRSLNEKKLTDQAEHMKKCFEKSAEKFGGTADIQCELEYPGYHIRETDDIINILKKASQRCDIPLKLKSTGGGSDTNVMNGKGIQAVDVSCGMDKVHSVNERIKIDDMVKATEFIISIIQSI